MDSSQAGDSCRRHIQTRTLFRGHGVHSACCRFPRYKYRSLPSSAVGARANSKYIVFGCSTIEVSPSCAAVSVIIPDVVGPVPREEGHIVSIESTVPCTDTENHSRCRRGLRAECLVAAFRTGNFSVTPFSFPDVLLPKYP